MVVKISFLIDEKDIEIIDNQIFFEKTKIRNFKSTILTTKVHQSTNNPKNIDYLVATGNKTSILMNHPKGNEIFNELHIVHKENIAPNYGTMEIDYWPGDIVFDYMED